MLITSNTSPRRKSRESLKFGKTKLKETKIEITKTKKKKKSKNNNKQNQQSKF